MNSRLKPLARYVAEKEAAEAQQAIATSSVSKNSEQKVTKIAEPKKQKSKMLAHQISYIDRTVRSANNPALEKEFGQTLLVVARNRPRAAIDGERSISTLSL